MPAPAVFNGIPMIMAKGPDLTSRAFDLPPVQYLYVDGLPVIPLLGATMGGQAVVSALPAIGTLRVPTSLGQSPLIYEGQTVTTADGYSGVVTPLMATGPRMSVA